MKKPPLPSKKRYDEKNPSVTFRMTKEEKLELQKMSEALEKSISDIIHDYFFNPISGAITIFNLGIKYGRSLAQEHDQNFYFCSICSEKLIMHPNTRPHHAMVQYMLDHGWGHEECPNKNRQDKQ